MKRSPREGRESDGEASESIAITRFGVAAAILTTVPWSLFWVSTRLVGWDSPKVASFWGYELRASRFATSFAVTTLAFFSVWAVVRPLSAMRLPVLDFVTDTLRITQRLRIGWLSPLLLGIAVVVSGLRAHEGKLDPWLWSLAAVLEMGLVASALSVPKWRRRRKSSAPDASRPLPATTDADVWWQRFLSSPLYHGEVYQQFSISQVRDHRQSTTPPRIPEELRSIHVALTGGEPHAHVSRLFDAIATPSTDSRAAGLCVVDLPHGAGLTAAIGALAIYQATQRFERTIIVTPSRRRSEHLAARLSALVRQDLRWGTTIRVSQVSGFGDIAPAQSYEDVPHIVIADPVGLDAILRSSSRMPWQHVFRALGLVVVVGSYDMIGTRGAHVASLLRRLRAASTRSGVQPQYVVECVAADEHQAFLSKLLGRQVPAAALLQGHDIVRRPVNVISWIPTIDIVPPPDQSERRRSFLQDARNLAGGAVEAGLNTLLILAHPHVADVDLFTLREEVLSRAGRTEGVQVVTAMDQALPGPVWFDVVIYAGFPSSRVELEHEIALVGVERGPGTKIVILVSPYEPQSLHAVRRRHPLAGLRAPTATLEVANRSIVELHARALTGRQGSASEDLKELGDVEQIIQGWQRDGRVRVVGPAALSIISPAVEAEAFFQPSIDVDSAGEGVACIRAVGDRAPLAYIDAGRATHIAYPDALLVYQGIRYVVRRRVGNEGDVEVTTTPEPDQFTYPLMEVDVDPGEGAKLVRQRIAGTANLTIASGEVTIHERVVGYGRREMSQPEAAPTLAHYDGTGYSRPPFNTTALVLGVDASPATPEVVHTIAHALRTVAPSFLHYRDRDLGQSVIAHCEWMGGSTALVLYDNAAFGLGVTELFGFSLREQLLPAAFDLLHACPCTDGCTACVYNPTCKKGLMVEGLDKLGALKVLGMLLGRDQQALDALQERSTAIRDPYRITQLAAFLQTELLAPMLGITVRQSPIVVLDDDLPETCLGRYEQEQQTIRIRPLPLRQSVGVLVHELAHAWSLEGNVSEHLLDQSWGDSRLVFLEGFAQWVEAKAMDHYGFASEIKSISGWAPDEYGMGFRFFLSLEKDRIIGGVPGVVRFVRAPEQQWLESYFNSVVYRGERAAIEQAMRSGSIAVDWIADPEDPSRRSTNPDEADRRPPSRSDTGTTPRTKEHQTSNVVDADIGDEVSEPVGGPELVPTEQEVDRESKIDARAPKVTPAAGGTPRSRTRRKRSKGH